MKFVNGLFWAARLGCLGFPLWMSLGCYECANARATFGFVGLYVLPWAGTTYGLFLCLTAKRRREKNWYFGAVSLATFVLIVLLFALAFAGGKMCYWCYYFWGCHLVLLAELFLMEEWRLLRAVTAIGILLTGGGFSAIELLPESKMWLNDRFSEIGIGIVPLLSGPPVGMKIPEHGGVSEDCVVVFWTDCPKCMQLHLGEIAEKIGSQKVFVFAAKGYPEIPRVFPNSDVDISLEQFENWQVTVDGPPVALRIYHGRVAESLTQKP
ncbi:MAG TPA: hypothetical protein VMQ44_00955 [Candidatus Saccharimonadales bacterium]|nr:hypothetical protein [Candidatus Saccharimonadales bacterium]